MREKTPTKVCTKRLGYQDGSGTYKNIQAPREMEAKEVGTEINGKKGELEVYSEKCTLREFNE